MTEDLRALYVALDLEPGASSDEIRAAYLDLVKIWHPDRHQNEPERLRQRAEQKMKQISAAYEKLRGADSAAPRELYAMDFGGLWGYVDERGNTAIYPEYLSARDFRDGLAAVRLADKWGYIDSGGTCVITPLYEDCGDFSEGLAAVKWYSRWGYIGRDGGFLIQPKFQDAGPFRDGSAEIVLGARLGRVSRTGEVTFLRDRLAAPPSC
jgi:hypothetical protein